MRAYEENMLDRPDVIPDDGTCAICGRHGATNKHHVIPKGMGGRSKSIEARIPLILLCGMGNTSGCHGKFHSNELHIRWHDGWQIKETPGGMRHIDALMSGDGWEPLWSWEEGHGEPR